MFNTVSINSELLPQIALSSRHGLNQGSKSALYINLIVDLICIYTLENGQFLCKTDLVSVFYIYLMITLLTSALYFFIAWKCNDLFTPQNTEWCIRTSLHVYCNTTDV